MGNSSSKRSKASTKGKGKATASQPQVTLPEVPMQIPQQRRGADGIPIATEHRDLDTQTLRDALSLMARFIHGHGQDIYAVTVGGAVSTLLLRTRFSTHDVDFFGSGITRQQRMLIANAVKYAEHELGQARLGNEWFNNSVELFMGKAVNQRITEEAFYRREVVFQKPGLTLYAAPWSYALAGKIDRMSKRQQARAQDLPDAVHYLHRVVRVEGRSVTATQVRAWCREYQKFCEDSVLQVVEEAYRRTYPQAGVGIAF